MLEILDRRERSHYFISKLLRLDEKYKDFIKKNYKVVYWLQGEKSQEIF
jgi:hypothetical protein